MLARRAVLLAPLALAGCSWFDDLFADKKNLCRASVKMYSRTGVAWLWTKAPRRSRCRVPYAMRLGPRPAAILLI